MTLEIALRNSLSGLNVQQKSLSIAAQNLARASEEGFVRLQESIEYDGLGGTKIGHIFRQIDELLEVELRNQATNAEYTSTISRLMERVQRIFGQPDLHFNSNPNENPSNIASILDNFFLSITTLSSMPESNVQKDYVVSRAVDLSNVLSNTTFSLQKLRINADQEIHDSIEVVNQALVDLYSVNREIAYRQPFDEFYANLEIQKSKALNQLAKYLPITVTHKDDGRAFVATSGGQVILDDVLFRLEYTSTLGVDDLIENAEFKEISITCCADGSNQQDRILVSSDGAKTKLNSGKIKALLEMRDHQIPLIVDQLSNFTDIFVKQVNEIYTSGNCFPGLSSVTGNTVVTGSTALDYTGSVKIALLDINGNAAKYENGNKIYPLVVSLSDLANFSDLNNEINQYYKTNGQRLTIKERGIYDIQLSAISCQDSVFSFDFDIDNHENSDQQVIIDDIELTYFDSNTGTEVTVNNARLSTIEGDSWTAFAGERKRSGIENSISMRSLPIDIQDFTIKVRMRVADDNYIFDYQVNKNYIEKSKRYPVTKTSGGFSEIIFEKQKVYATATFVDDKGDIVAKKNTNDLSFLKINVEQEDIFLAMSPENSNKIGHQQRNFVHDLDFYNLFSENGAAKVAVNQQLIDHPSHLNVGKLRKNALGSGNAELLMQISEIAHQQTLFPAAGALPKITNTFGGYVVEMIEYTSFRLFEANANDERESRFRDLLNSDFNSISGVNSEEELQKSVIIQNAYNSLAHIVSVVQELFKIFIQSI